MIVHASIGLNMVYFKDYGIDCRLVDKNPLKSLATKQAFARVKANNPYFE
jgi:hypothetical protein